MEVTPEWKNWVNGQIAELNKFKELMTLLLWVAFFMGFILGIFSHEIMLHITFR